MKAQKEFAKNALDGLTEEEKYMCMAVFNKICANADAYLKNMRREKMKNHFCYNQLMKKEK